MRMFAVNAKCGHVGMNYYTVKTFAIFAESREDAAAKVRQFPRVKHHHKDAIQSVDYIDTIRYNEINRANHADPYFSYVTFRSSVPPASLKGSPKNGIIPMITVIRNIIPLTTIAKQPSDTPRST